MKGKVIVVSKTHLDLGFTGLASEILDKYTDIFIPNSINIAKQVNKGSKKFVWTVGSWLLKEILSRGTDAQKSELYDACMRGDIVAHGYPFTTHTELMDADLVEYGLSIIKDFDKQFGRQTISAKMTDVPGHTIALVPLLAKAGIKLLHIGVNAASAVPDLPQCFVWKKEESEVIVIYEGSYGGEFRTDLIPDVLYFDHSLDNHGPRNVTSVLNNLERIKAKYPEHEVVAGTLDDYTRLLLKAKDKLPIVTSEIGDSWIHGIGTDPFKTAALRQLLRLKGKWLQDGSMNKNSPEYKGFMDKLMCVTEHTWGSDMKCFFGDYSNYLRKDFDEARKKDIKIKRGGLYNLKCAKMLREKGKKGIYKRIEKGWIEQREYLDSAVLCLNDDHMAQAKAALAPLMPGKFLPTLPSDLPANKQIRYKDWSFAINNQGGIKMLGYKEEIVLKDNDNPLIEYASYGKKDYDYWLKHYTRDFFKTQIWAVGDFARPFISRVDKKFKQGRFGYTLKHASYKIDSDGLQVVAMLQIDDYCNSNLGASKEMEAVYRLTDNGLELQVIWLDKPANRLTEATYLRIFPNCKNENVKFCKLGQLINPYDVVKNGNRNISAVESVEFRAKDNFAIQNLDCPLVSLGKGKILQFDNIFESVEKDGLAYVLHNNVWGTNFPLWYDDNASFRFALTIKD